MEDINDVRAKNLEKVRDERFEGKNVCIAKELKVSPQRISNLLTKKTPFSEKVARQFESQLGLSKYHLDVGVTDIMSAYSRCKNIAKTAYDIMLNYKNGKDEERKNINNEIYLLIYTNVFDDLLDASDFSGDVSHEKYTNILKKLP